jgi:hypothetical protein
MMATVKDISELTVSDIPTDPSSKAFADFRDRAAYVYVMGAYPTHIRTYFTTLLSVVSHSVRSPASLDKSFGSIKINEDMANRLMLDDHPMVRRVRLLLAEGYKLHRTGSITERRPYGRIPMKNPMTGGSVVVQIDGSVKDDRA